MLESLCKNLPTVKNSLKSWLWQKCFPVNFSRFNMIPSTYCVSKVSTSTIKALEQCPQTFFCRQKSIQNKNKKACVWRFSGKSYEVWISEAVLHRCSYKKVLWKYSANLQESTHAEVRLRHGCSLVNLLRVLGTPFSVNTYKALVLEFP